MTQPRQVIHPPTDRYVSGEFKLLMENGFFRPSRSSMLRRAVAPGNMLYNGGPVMTTPGVFVIYWRGKYARDPVGELPYLTAFLKSRFEKNPAESIGTK